MKFARNLITLLYLCALALPIAAQSATASVKVKTELGHATLLKNQKQKAYIRIHLEGEKPEKTTERPPVNIAIVIDKSGSMGGAKMDRAKDAAIMAIDRMSSSDFVSVITYDTKVNVLVPATKVGDKEHMQERIDSLRAGGSTALYAGTNQGLKEVRTYLNRNNVNRIILISDGLANIGPSKPEIVAELGKEAAKEGIAITTIGLGLGYNEDLMAKLAFNSDGNHSFVKNADDLIAVFNNEFGDVLSVVAQEIEVDVIFHDKIMPLRSLGREAKITGNTAKIRLNQIYGSQRKEIILEVEASGEITEEDLQFAKVQIKYRDMKSKSNTSQQLQVAVRLVEEEKDWEASANKSVMTSVTTQIAVIANERAVKMRDRGDLAAARQVLTENAAYLKSAGNKYESQKLKKLSETNMEEAENLDGAKWSRTRKLMRARQHQGKTQQKF